MKKQLLLLSGVTFVFFIVVLVFQFASFEKKPSQKTVLNFPLDQLQAFAINHFTLGYFFQKNKKGQWQVKRSKNTLAKNIEQKEGVEQFTEDKAFQMAHQNHIETLLKELSDIKLDDPITTGTSQTNLFQINAHSLHMIFYGKDQKELQRLYIGKQGPDVFTSFVKIDHQNQIYLVEKHLAGIVHKDLTHWIKNK